MQKFEMSQCFTVILFIIMAHIGEKIDVKSGGGWPFNITETQLIHFLQENIANKSSEIGFESNMILLFGKDLDLKLLGYKESL